MRRGSVQKLDGRMGDVKIGTKELLIHCHLHGKLVRHEESGSD